ncbi:MAG TPA: UvrD-helicase domain-containing protein [Patescibacteria group bacterium]|nr:UvrD-helicase domain-containing protein [Patescibacteria group bacterium]
MKSNLFKSLNTEQKKAVSFCSGPAIILAGAGSGKTRVLTHKVLNLIENYKISPTSVLMITFTNKAAGEMKNRMKYTLGYIGTFHSFCCGVLRTWGRKIGVAAGFSIYDDADQKDAIKDIMTSLRLPKKYSPATLLYTISSAKNQLMDAKTFKKMVRKSDDQTTSVVYDHYEKILAKNNALDFDDLLFKTVVLFKTHRDVLSFYQELFRYILVDEFHDTNFAQYILTKLLGQKYQNVTIVGDFSQSIYSWRGAEIENLKKFQKDFPKSRVFHLEENYRSTQRILDFAYTIISQNQTHPILKLHTNNEEGSDVTIEKLENEQYEAIFIADLVEKILIRGEKAAVLYRINAQSRIIEEALLHRGIPYTLVGGTRFYGRKEIKDILSYIRLLANPSDMISLKRALSLGKRRFGDFKKLYEKTAKQLPTTLEVIDQILTYTKYTELFDEKVAEDAARLENIKELRSVAVRFPVVFNFLEQVALVESEYSESEKRHPTNDNVSLMTLHQAKGLEFPYVFIAGLEEGILPHAKALYDTLNLEEERRLFYVGITRAQKELYITHVSRRFLFGRMAYAVPSRFIESTIAIPTF